MEEEKVTRTQRRSGREMRGGCSLGIGYPRQGEIAACAVFLASEAADMINGADLLVDGGYTIR